MMKFTPLIFCKFLIYRPCKQIAVIMTVFDCKHNDVDSFGLLLPRSINMLAVSLMIIQ